VLVSAGLVLAPGASAEERIQLAVPAEDVPAAPDTPATPAPEGNPEEDPSLAPAGDGENADFTVDPVERIAQELAHALGSQQSLDFRGLAPSLYQGKWFMPGKDDVRKCIIDRESNANYKAVSAGGLYRGAYQFSRGLAIGATHMMEKEVRKEFGDSAVEIVQRLRQMPIQQWNRYWQDRAFWTIWRNGKGSSHWGGGAWSCRNN
jgi:hypothetical protein